MKRTMYLLVFLAVGACSNDEAPENIALFVAGEVERLAAAGSYWPGFDPMAIPLAVYDGEHTYLFRHPDVPEGFSQVDGSNRGELIYEGRHSAVTANSSADIGGTLAATLLADDVKSAQRVSALPGVALHEAFHVFQREQHPGWAANEADLFVYPIDDPKLLALRRLETEALRRAVSEADPNRSACWANHALALREDRFAAMSIQFAAYERGTEMNEGLATYVQFKAEGREDVEIPEIGFGATDVRMRAYETGLAIALLLDRLDTEWPAWFAANGERSLDQALQSALESRDKDRTGRCAFTEAGIDNVNQKARSDVSAVVARQAEKREEFDRTETWRITIYAADGEPLWPQGFDPLNVERVQGGIIHGRLLRLGNDSGYVEAMDTAEVDIEALTMGAGPHPLFNGVEQVSIVGFDEPEIMTDGEHVAFRTPGLEGQFERASVRHAGSKIEVHVGGGSKAWK